MKKTIFIIFIALIVSACTKDKTEPIPEASGDCFPISYKYNIRPIIENSCKTQAGPGTGCHDAWIDNYPPINSYIVSGIWQNEIFIEKTMPKIPNTWFIDSLSQDDLKTIQCWIDQGFPEN